MNGTVTINPEVDNVINDFTTQGKVFTAYDVTVEARSRVGKGTNIPHVGPDGVRDHVHNVMGGLMHLYESAGQDLAKNGQPIGRVIVYYPIGGSALDHPLAIDAGYNQPSPAATAPSGINVVSASPLASDDDDTDTDDDTDDDSVGKQADGSYVRGLTKEKRLNVPKTLIDQVSVTGGTVDVYVGSELLPQSKQGDGRVRISFTDLSKAGTGPKYKVSVDTTKNCINVSQA